jgi:hypothetical protein
MKYVCFVAYIGVYALAAGMDFSDGHDTTLSCTNFAVSIGDRVLFGNSEDGGLTHPLGRNPESSHLFYYSASENDYACMFVGWLWEGDRVSAQGGMNDQGLCYDLTGIPDVPMNSHPERPYSWQTNWVLFDVLRRNATVAEVIDYFGQVDWSEHVWFQWFFADAAGDMVIVSPGEDGELAFTRKPGGTDGFLTQTNFNRAVPDQHIGKYPCPRYETSESLLQAMISENELAISRFSEVLHAVARKGQFFTGYSNVFDVTNRKMHLSLLGQFDELVEIDVARELARTESYRQVPMSAYFSEETVSKGLDYYRGFKIRAVLLGPVLTVLAIAAIVGVMAIFVVLLVRRLRAKRRQGLRGRNLNN